MLVLLLIDALALLLDGKRLWIIYGSAASPTHLGWLLLLTLITVLIIRADPIVTSFTTQNITLRDRVLIPRI